jgi:hypothetical protein
VGPTVYPRVKVTFKDGRFRGALRSAIWQYWFEEGSANLRVETNVAPAVRSNFTGMIFVGIFTKVPE